MRKHFAIGLWFLLAIGGVYLFWYLTTRHASKSEVLKATPVEELSGPTNAPALVTLEQIPTEKLFKALSTPPPTRFAVVTNQYNGAPEVQSFIDSTMIEQANRINSIFRFASESDGRLKTLGMDDIAYSATTMTGTFKFSLQTRPDFRFLVCFDHGDFTLFRDMAFDSSVLDRNFLKYEALRRATNYITKEQAVQLVEETLYKLGYTRQDIKPFGEPYIRQLAFTNEGKQHVLPYFFIDYRDPTSESEPKAALLSAEVVGIEPGGRITQLVDAYWKVPRIEVPPGYREKVEAYWRAQGKTPPRQ